jgi:hypothetical protein
LAEILKIINPAADDDEPVAANRDLSGGKARNFTPDPEDPRPTLGDAIDERREEHREERQTETQPRHLSAAVTAAGRRGRDRCAGQGRPSGETWCNDVSNTQILYGVVLLVQMCASGFGELVRLGSIL